MSGGALAIRGPQSQLSEWIPILLWSAIIFVFSTSAFSAANTAKVVSPIVRWFFPTITWVTLGLINSLIRKSAHFTEYAILFWLLIRGPLKERPLMAMAVCVVYALTDEAHQIFVLGRTASIYDVALDSTGAMFSGFLRSALSELG